MRVNLPFIILVWIVEHVPYITTYGKFDRLRTAAENAEFLEERALYFMSEYQRLKNKYEPDPVEATDEDN